MLVAFIWTPSLESHIQLLCESQGHWQSDQSSLNMLWRYIIWRPSLGLCLEIVRSRSVGLKIIYFRHDKRKYSRQNVKIFLWNIYFSTCLENTQFEYHLEFPVPAVLNFSYHYLTLATANLDIVRPNFNTKIINKFCTYMVSHIHDVTLLIALKYLFVFM